MQNTISEMILHLQLELLYHYGSKTISYLGPKIWDPLLKNIKNSKNINILKSDVKFWKLENFPYRFCKIHLANAEFA